MPQHTPIVPSADELRALDQEDLELDELLDPEEACTELYEHFRFVVDKGQSPIRIDKYLTDRMEYSSRNRIQQAADAGAIMVNGKAVKSNYKVKPLDIISIVMDRPRQTLEIIPEEIPLEIIYEDEYLMVVNKKPGMVVHPGRGNYTGTLVNAIAWHLKDEPSFNSDDPRLGLVHRIDKDTSGLLVIAKDPFSKAHLSEQFFNKTTKRQYNALVWGIVKEDTGRIEGHVGRNLRNRENMDVFPDGDHGKHAVTHYEVIERLGYVTLVRCHLETGRTHQIRVHMRYIGHTLFNDARYGGEAILKGNRSGSYKQFISNCFDACPRQALHARTLGFEHPITHEIMHFEAPLPEDMTALLEKWRRYSSSPTISQ